MVTGRQCDIVDVDLGIRRRIVNKFLLPKPYKMKKYRPPPEALLGVKLMSSA